MVPEDQIDIDIPDELIPAKVVGPPIKIYKMLYYALVIILLVVCVIGLAYVSYKLTVDGTKCIRDPIIYYNGLGPDQCYCGSQQLTSSGNFQDT